MSLPLRAKVAIRELWTKEDAATRKAIKSLQDILGRDVHCEPEWQMLNEVLLPAYPDDSSAVVSAVASFVQAWCLGVSELLEDDDDGEAWGETLLEAMKKTPSGTLKLILETTNSSIPSTSWDTSKNGFVLRLPAKNPPDDPLVFVANFRSQAYATFTDPVSSTDAADPDGWADVVVTATKPTLEPEGPTAYLPTVASLPQPDKLFLRPPYHLLVYSRGMDEIEIQSSHSPSLNLLSGYLKKWCRTNARRTDKRELVEITLHQSPFGLAPTHDSLMLEIPDFRHGDKPGLSLPLVFHLVENVLGYRQVRADGSCWQFRRDSPLKDL